LDKINLNIDLYNKCFYVVPLKYNIFFFGNHLYFFIVKLVKNNSALLKLIVYCANNFLYAFNILEYWHLKSVFVFYLYIFYMCFYINKILIIDLISNSIIYNVI
jgi:hypothetical protein